MIISRETLILEANNTGFRAEILEKVIRLIDLLNAFKSNEFLQSRVALKGGTALNLFYFDLPRLSVDIDLNYVGSLDREAMLVDKPKIVSTIEAICVDKQYQSIRQPREHAGGKWRLTYKSELVRQGQLEIDLNFISRATLFGIKPLDSIKLGSFQAKGIPVLDYHDLIGGKLSALFSRHKSRDLFDTYTIFSCPNKPDMLKTKLAFIIYGAAARMDIRHVSLGHVYFDANELKNMLLPVLRNETLIETKKVKQWATNLIKQCKESLSELIKFDMNEKQFLTSLIEQGEIIPELITTDVHLTQLISQHPVLLWKAMNVKNHIKK